MVIRFGLCGLMAALLMSCCQANPNAKDIVRVYAASSLTDVLPKLKAQFEKNNPSIKVVLSFAGSQILRLQLEQGAPADLFISANKIHMDALKQKRIIGETQLLAHNKLVLIVPEHNPAHIESYHDLVAAKRLVLGTRHVPVGYYAHEVLALSEKTLGSDFRGQVLKNLVSEESNVRLVRAKVELGEADAAIVYQSDFVASKRLKSIPIPEAFNVKTDYLVGSVRQMVSSVPRQHFLSFLMSKGARDIFEHDGFDVQ